MEYLLLAVSMAANLGGGITKKYIENRLTEKDRMHMVLSAVLSVFSCVTLLIICLFSGGLKFSLFTVLVGVLFGVITAMQTIFHMRALQYGPMSYTSVIISLSMIIPALSGYFIWNEPLTVLQIVGIALIAACMVCSVDTKEKSDGAEHQTPTVMKKWLPAVGAAFILTGSIGVLQKWHQNTVGSSEVGAFLIVAFAVSFIYSTAGIFLAGGKKSGDEKLSSVLKRDLRPLIFVLMAVCGVCVGLNNHINLYLSGVLPSAVFFPVVNGGGLILSLIASIILFRERLSLRQWIGIGFGFAAIMCLCWPV